MPKEFTPHNYQQYCIDRIISDPAIGLFLDMGLGKTLQILYFIDWHSRMNPNHKPYLIVAPISLLENWENEYNRFFMAPRMEITRLSSKEVPRHFDKDIIHKMQRMDIILTNYESLRNSQLNFCAVEFDIVAVLLSPAIPPLRTIPLVVEA